MRAKEAAVLTSAIWIGLITVVFFASLSRRPSGFPQSLAEFQATDHSEWFALPDDARRISIQFYGGRDINYRALMFQASNSEVVSFLDSCIEKNVQYSGQTVTKKYDRQFSLDGLFEVFQYGSEYIPSWWIRFANRENSRASFVYWNRKGHGNGYLVVTNTAINYVNVLQFSQQHLDLEALTRAFPAK